jgi:hypothetical protein
MDKQNKQDDRWDWIDGKYDGMSIRGWLYLIFLFSCIIGFAVFILTISHGAAGPADFMM